eukprot:PhM_4_TR6090/c0_g1_i1/m.22463
MSHAIADDEVSRLLDDTVHKLRALHDLLNDPELRTQLAESEQRYQQNNTGPPPRVMSTETVTTVSTTPSTSSTPRTPCPEVPSTPPFHHHRGAAAAMLPRYEALRTTRRAGLGASHVPLRGRWGAAAILGAVGFSVARPRVSPPPQPQQQQRQRSTSSEGSQSK